MGARFSDVEFDFLEFDDESETTRRDDDEEGGRGPNEKAMAEKKAYWESQDQCLQVILFFYFLVRPCCVCVCV